MKPAAARAIAERAHRGQFDTDETALIDHVRRVAAAAPRAARSVAWLHEILEWTDIPEEALLAEGLSDEELRALRLLTRPPGDHLDERYLAHIARIRGSAGTAGAMARAVKRADLEDRVEHPVLRPGGWAPPYARGLAALEQRHALRGRTRVRAASRLGKTAVADVGP